MKLIDILVRELPKRGGWPEGVEEIWQDYDRMMRPLGWFHDELCDDHRRQHYDAHVKINKKQYEAALAASKPEWDGEGLPPVGCECERKDIATGNWYRVTVVYQSEWVTVVREVNEQKGSDLVELAVENYGNERLREFRPIRSEVDKRRDETVKKLMSIIGGPGGPHSEVKAREIYEAIKSGKIVID